MLRFLFRRRRLVPLTAVALAAFAALSLCSPANRPESIHWRGLESGYESHTSATLPAARDGARDGTPASQPVTPTRPQENHP